MLGSPNYVRFVYDGDGSATPEPGDGGPNGSAQIAAIFNNYVAGRGLATAPTAFDGRSDYGPFIAVGIPAGVSSAAPRVSRPPTRPRSTGAPPERPTTRALPPGLPRLSLAFQQ
jgi:Zn-dependent M28 family amino/carboxypeptidase